MQKPTHLNNTLSVEYGPHIITPDASGKHYNNTRSTAAVHEKLIDYYAPSSNTYHEKQPDVVAVHGICASGEVFEWLQEQLAIRYRINMCLLDLPGHGASHLPRNRKSMNHVALKDYISATKATFKYVENREGGEKPVYVGHSMGNVIGGELIGEEELIQNALFLAPIPEGGTLKGLAKFAFQHPISTGRILVPPFRAQRMWTDNKVTEEVMLSGNRENHDINDLKLISGNESLRVLTEMAFENGSRIDNLKNAVKNGCRIVLMQGTADEVSPAHKVYGLANTVGISENMLLFQDGSHYFFLQEEFREQVLQIIVELVENQKKLNSLPTR